MSDPEPFDGEELLARQMAASMGAMMDTARTFLAPRVREILERNEGIVDQREESLRHLTDELVAALLPELPDFTEG